MGTTGASGWTASEARHTQDPNFLAVNGHVKYFVGAKVSIGWSQSSPSAPETYGRARYLPYGAGTQNNTVTITVNGRVQPGPTSRTRTIR